MAGPRLPVLLVLTAGLAAAGCVERRFVVETNVPGAQVYIDNVPYGPSPSDARWEYPGKYEFRAVAQGFEPLREVRDIRPKWYEYPGLDFFFEVLWPFHIEDVRRVQLTLVPAAQPRTDELLDAASRLREQARTLPPPEELEHGASGGIVPTPVVIPVMPEPGSPQPTTVPAGAIR
jgi:hypothetical protein